MKARVKTKIYMGCESGEDATGKGKVQGAGRMDGGAEGRKATETNFA